MLKLILSYRIKWWTAGIGEQAYSDHKVINYTREKKALVRRRTRRAWLLRSHSGADRNSYYISTIVTQNIFFWFSKATSDSTLEQKTFFGWRSASQCTDSWRHRGCVQAQNQHPRPWNCHLRGHLWEWTEHLSGHLWNQFTDFTKREVHCWLDPSRPHIHLQHSPWTDMNNAFASVKNINSGPSWWLLV